MKINDKKQYFQNKYLKLVKSLQQVPAWWWIVSRNNDYESAAESDMSFSTYNEFSFFKLDINHQSTPIIHQSQHSISPARYFILLGESCITAAMMQQALCQFKGASHQKIPAQYQSSEIDYFAKRAAVCLLSINSSIVLIQRLFCQEDYITTAIMQQALSQLIDVNRQSISAQNCITEVCYLLSQLIDVNHQSISAQNCITAVCYLLDSNSLSIPAQYQFSEIVFFCQES